MSFHQVSNCRPRDGRVDASVADPSRMGFLPLVSGSGPDPPTVLLPHLQGVGVEAPAKPDRSEAYRAPLPKP